MRNKFRVAGISAAAVFLLAAGEAPNGDIAFLNDIPTAPAEAFHVPTVEMVDESHEFAEPNLGLVMPEAGTLTQLVSEVRNSGEPEMSAELKCLASAVYFESKGEPLDGQLAVAQVIMNRVESGRFGAGVCGVVKAPKQFSFVRGGTIPTATNMAQWATAKAIALIALSDSWHEIVPDATHFHATRVSPGWKLRRVATVGQHVFYR
ncbi:cell wall hydrolase [Sandaracinobacter neustonicus]|nr:cell wall hydrolase [Sandaracinobacter neustonicus]